MSVNVYIRRLTIVVPASRRADAEMIGRLVGLEIGRAAGGRTDPAALARRLAVDGAGAPPPLIARRAAAAAASHPSSFGKQRGAE